MDAVARIDRTKGAIVAEYRRRTPGSAAAFARASRSLAGGTTGNLRHFAPYPLYFEAGDGPRVRDVDANSYIDCFLCNGPLLLGHRHPALLAEMRAHESLGSLVVNPTLAVDLAEELQRVIPAAERVRFLNSGTEAVLTAVRYARAFTGRQRIVKFFGHYHGQDDQFLVGVGPAARTLGEGVSLAAIGATTVLRYGDEAALATTLSEGDVAAVLLDPAMHSGGLWGSRKDYLQAARSLTAKHGALLIFDEVITGFRLALGGAQSYYGVTPDLATYAKALGAGEKLAAVVGSERVLHGVSPDATAAGPRVFQSGTGNDGTVALAAALAAVRTYRALDAAGDYHRLANYGGRLADGLRTAFSSRGIPLHVNQLGSMLQLFTTNAPADFERFGALDPEPLFYFYLALINEGVLLSLPTSNHIYLSFVHTDRDLEQILTKVGEVLDRYDFHTFVATRGRAAAPSGGKPH